MIDPLNESLPTQITRRLALRRAGTAGLLATAVALGASWSSAAAHQDDTDTPAFLDGYVSAWSSGDVDRIAALYADDVAFEQVATKVRAQGLAKLRPILTLALGVFTEFEMTLIGGFRSGEMAAVEAQISTKYSGQAPGLPPGAGQPVTFRFVSILAVEGKKIRRETAYFDVYDLLVQIGVLPAVGADPTDPATPAA